MIAALMEHFKRIGNSVFKGFKQFNIFKKIRYNCRFLLK